MNTSPVASFDILSHPSGDTPSMRAVPDWASGSLPPLSGYEIGQFDFKGQGPFLVQGFHGTTHAFETFCASKRGILTGAFGRVNYFSSSYDDAERNYAGNGPDMQVNLESAAERMAGDIQTDPEAYGLPEDVDLDAISTRATALAQQQLMGDYPHVKDCLLRFSNPFILDGAHHEVRRASAYAPRLVVPDHSPLLFPDADDYYSDPEQEVLDDYGLGHLTDEAREEALQEYEDEIFERSHERRDAKHQELADLIANITNSLGERYKDPLPEAFYDLDCMTHQTLYNALKNDEAFSLLTCFETGDMISHEAFARIVEALGYDAIILKNADQAFPNMGIAQGAAHIHIFDQYADNIFQVAEIPVGQVAPLTASA